MTGRLKDLTFGINGEQHITITVNEDFREQYESLKDTDIDVTIKKRKKRRSLDANAYAWVLIDKIASALSMPKTEVYRDAIKNIGGVSQIVCIPESGVDKLRQNWEHNGIGWQTETLSSKLDGCINVVLYYGSSTYDTAQMSALIDALIQDAKSLGIETMPPHKLQSLLEQYDK